MCDSSLITLLSHFSSAGKTTEDIEENFGPEVWRKLLSLHAPTRRIPRRILSNEQMVAQKLTDGGGGGKRAYVRHFSAKRTKFPLSILLHHTVKGSIQLHNLTTSIPVFPLIANFFSFSGEKRSGGSTRKRKQMRRVIIRDFSNFFCRWCNRRLCPIKRP